MHMNIVKNTDKSIPAQYTVDCAHRDIPGAVLAYSESDTHSSIFCVSLGDREDIDCTMTEKTFSESGLAAAIDALQIEIDWTQGYARPESLLGRVAATVETLMDLKFGEALHAGYVAH